MYNEAMDSDQFTKLLMYIEDFRSETIDKFSNTISKDDLMRLVE